MKTLISDVRWIIISRPTTAEFHKSIFFFVPQDIKSTTSAVLGNAEGTGAEVGWRFPTIVLHDVSFIFSMSSFALRCLHCGCPSCLKLPFSHVGWSFSAVRQRGCGQSHLFDALYHKWFLLVTSFLLRRGPSKCSKADVKGATVASVLASFAQVVGMVIFAVFRIVTGSHCC